VVDQGHERGVYGWWGWNAQAELQSNLKELDRILASLEEDLQELHTTPTTAKGEPVISRRRCPLQGAALTRGRVVWLCAQRRVRR
jgi:hypothetical protein